MMPFPSHVNPPPDSPIAPRPAHRPRHRRCHLALVLACVSGGLAAHALVARAQRADQAVVHADGVNPHPVQLRLPPEKPLSVVALLGKSLFLDVSLSGSGRQSCASCHSPANGYNPPNALTVQPGGAQLDKAGYRPPPSLAYLYRQQPFSIGPDTADIDVPVDLNRLAAAVRHDPRARKSAAATPAVAAMVPQGGLFWDGRADSLQRQAYMPMLNPVEMANASVTDVARKLAHGRYRQSFAQLFGAAILDDPRQLVAEAMFAIGRYEIEDPSFHAFTSKYDAWLQGRARFTSAQMRGLRLFNDPARGNCAACHTSRVGRDGLPPLFTDAQYEALGVPRNPHLALNRNPRFHDLGLCGPFRTDLAGQTQYCGMFLTPTLRNVDRRSVFFHNGVYRTLHQVLEFYNLRSVAPQRIYPRGADGRLALDDDLPTAYRGNVDTTDAPFNRHVGDPPPLTERDIRDILAFLHTLDDGYVPAARSLAAGQRDRYRGSSKVLAGALR